MGRPYHGEHNEVNERDVSSEYFKTIGARLVRGRSFTDADDASKPRVVIINQSLARKYFPGEDPIGKQVGDTSLTPKSLREIIGVVEDIREGALDADIWPAEYVPFNQSPDTYFSLVVRTAQPGQSIYRRWPPQFVRSTGESSHSTAPPCPPGLETRPPPTSAARRPGW